MQPDGLGALNLAYEQLKEKLFKEGACDEENKKPLPDFPKKIGVATSNIGAAVEDIKNITNRRYPLAELVIVPTVVQGQLAPADIVRSIKLLDNMNDVDVIILGRGGGSVEDLWAFNTEEVARAVIACKTPIVSAVGHETDFTICDFVSDLRAPTPSAAAELVCPDMNMLLNYTSSIKSSLNSLISSRLDYEIQRMNDASENSVLADFNSVVDNFNDNLETLSERIKEAVEYNIEKKMYDFSNAVAKLDALSPLAVMSRGYSVVQMNGMVVKNIKSLKKGDEFLLTMNGGTAICRALEVDNNG